MASHFRATSTAWLGVEAVVVTIFADDNKRYLSTDLMREEPAKAGFLSPDLELKGFRACKRACTVCWDYDACTQCLPADVQSELDGFLVGKAGPRFFRFDFSRYSE